MVPFLLSEPQMPVYSNMVYGVAMAKQLESLCEELV